MDPTSGLVGAIGVILGTVIGRLLVKQTRHQIVVAVVMGSVGVLFAVVLWYVVPGYVGEPIGSVMRFSLGAIGVLAVCAVGVRRLLSSS